MIDTDKYEGHTLNNLEIDADLPTWGVYDGNGKVVADYNPTDDVDINEANARLIADAPLLLAEVKRLREENERLRDMVEKAVGYGAYDEEYARLHDATAEILNKHFGSSFVKAFWEAIE